MAKHSGRTVELDGRSIVVPPMTLKQLRTFTEDGTLNVLANMREDGIPSVAQLDAAAKVVHAAITRNEEHKQLTVEDVLDMLDLSNLGPVIEAVFGASGITKTERRPGEATSP